MRPGQEGPGYSGLLVLLKIVLVSFNEAGARRPRIQAEVIQVAAQYGLLQ